ISGSRPIAPGTSRKQSGHCERRWRLPRVTRRLARFCERWELLFPGSFRKKRKSKSHELESDGQQLNPQRCQTRRSFGAKGPRQRTRPAPPWRQLYPLLPGPPFVSLAHEIALPWLIGNEPRQTHALGNVRRRELAERLE